MKKGLIFSLIISFIVFLGLSIFAVVPKTDFSTNKIEKFNKFESSLIAELQNDDYSYTEINKNVSLSQLKEKVEPNSKNNQATIFNMEDNKILTTNELNEYCEQNDLILEETDNGYQVINKYALKRLIVFGTLPSNHNASKVISYDNMNILCYNSIEETKSAYLNLKSNNIEVTPDFIISATNTNEIEIQSTSFNNWSEVAVDLDAYNDYSTTKQAVVAVLDTGINTLHPVFENRLLKENDKIVGTSYYSSSYTYNKDNILVDLNIPMIGNELMINVSEENKNIITEIYKEIANIICMYYGNEEKYCRYTLDNIDETGTEGIRFDNNGNNSIIYIETTKSFNVVNEIVYNDVVVTDINDTDYTLEMMGVSLSNINITSNDTTITFKGNFEIVSEDKSQFNIVVKLYDENNNTLNENKYEYNNDNSLDSNNFEITFPSSDTIQLENINKYSIEIVK